MLDASLGGCNVFLMMSVMGEIGIFISVTPFSLYVLASVSHIETARFQTCLGLLIRHKERLFIMVRIPSLTVWPGVETVICFYEVRYHEIMILEFVCCQNNKAVKAISYLVIPGI